MDDLLVRELLEDCRSGDSSRQTLAIMKLQDFKVHKAVPILIELLTSPEENIRGLAVEALGWLGEEKKETVGPVLVRMLADSEERVRADALDALGRLQYKPAIEEVLSALTKDPEWLVRVSAAEALANLAEVGDLKILEGLEQALSDPIEPVRAYAACTLGILGTPKIIPKLQNYFELEESLDTKAEILAAQYRLGKQNALYPLLELLENADELLVEVILNILGDLADRKTPLILAEDSSIICKSLTKVAPKFFTERYHAEQVITQLKKLSL
jgi:HEAT repeat protein